MIDMFAGVIVASWVHMIARIITRPVDQWLAIPPRPIVETIKKSPFAEEYRAGHSPASTPSELNVAESTTSGPDSDRPAELNH